MRHETTYEGQAAIELEMAASQETGHYQFTFTGLDLFEIDMRPAIAALVKDFLAQIPVSAISSRPHRTIARVVVDACMRIREADDLNRVCLSGGTFQNLLLLGLSADGLRQHGFEVFTHQHVPSNDGGLSLGQAVIASEILLP